MWRLPVYKNPKDLEGVVLKTGLGAAPLLWLPGRGLQHISQLGSDSTP